MYVAYFKPRQVLPTPCTQISKKIPAFSSIPQFRERSTMSMRVAGGEGIEGEDILWSTKK